MTVQTVVQEARRRSAFTLLELLVVIGIIGTLLGLLLPAVQMVRAAAARLQCQKNLKEIALAAQNYHDTLGTFPPGINISPNSKDPNPSWNYPPPWAGPYTGSMAYLLPFIEEGNVYDQLYNFNPPGAFLATGALFQLNSTCPAWAYGWGPFDFQDPGLPPSLQNGTGAGYPKAINTKITTYLCPADPGINARVVVDRWGIYTAPPIGWLFLGDYVQNIPGYGAEMGRSNYVAVGGAFGKVSPYDNYLNHYQTWGLYTGIFYDNSQTRLTDITDGASNTLAFGEFLGGLHTNGPNVFGDPPPCRDFYLAWMGSGWMPTKWGLKPIYGPNLNDYRNGQFQSKHPGNAVNFAFADGSVHGISPSVDFTVFIYASGMQDGKVFSASDLDN
jgi:prepilin-type N-terminal cleavage/methylation domain-containing protein/prepilin-type processing-associated H-X9-DG protein